MKRPARPRFSLSGLILWVLDAIFFVSAIVVALVGLSMAFHHELGDFLKIDGHSAPYWQSFLLANLLWIVFFVVFWSVHLVLQSTRHNKPFTKRNIAIIYGVSAFSILLGLMSFSPALNRSIVDGKLTRIWLSFDNAPHDIRGWFASPVFMGLLLYAVAAVFGKGAQLYEMEQQLRQEQELTI